MCDNVDILQWKRTNLFVNNLFFFQAERFKTNVPYSECVIRIDTYLHVHVYVYINRVSIGSAIQFKPLARQTHRMTVKRPFLGML